MDVRIHWKPGTRSHHVEDYLAWQLRFEVGRLADRVTAVRAWFGEDENGRGRSDKHCALELEGAFGRLGRIFAAARGDDFYVAVNQAAKTIGCYLYA
jgi:hypothetical protein